MVLAEIHIAEQQYEVAYELLKSVCSRWPASHRVWNTYCRSACYPCYEQDLYRLQSIVRVQIATYCCPSNTLLVFMLVLMLAQALSRAAVTNVCRLATVDCCFVMQHNSMKPM